MLPSMSSNPPDLTDRQRAIRFVIARRGELGMTQAQLAEAAGVAERTVRSLEIGEAWPWARNLAAIARALKLDAGELDALLAAKAAS